MSTKIQGAFTIAGLIDGETVNPTLRVEGTPLVQRYNKGTTVFSPNFEAMAENLRPIVVVLLRGVSAGEVLPHQTLDFRYNDMLLTFDANGLSTNAGMVGYFKKISAYSTNVGGKTVSVPALRVMKNLVPISGYDNDYILVSGTVEVDGHSIPFQEIGKPVIIQESTGNQYDVVLSNDKGSQFTSKSESLTETARIFKDGVEISDYTGFTYKYIKMLGEGDVNMGTARTQVITTDDVDHTLRIRCDVYKDNALVASGLDEITDFSDTYYMAIKKTGITGNYLRKGQTVTITPVAVKASTGVEEPNLITTWTFTFKDNEGNPFILTGKDSATFTAPNAVISYEDVKRAKMGIGGYIGGVA